MNSVQQSVGLTDDELNKKVKALLFGGNKENNTPLKMNNSEGPKNVPQMQARSVQSSPIRENH